jgi:hypothetical protein
MQLKTTTRKSPGRVFCLLAGCVLCGCTTNSERTWRPAIPPNAEAVEHISDAPMGVAQTNFRLKVKSKDLNVIEFYDKTLLSDGWVRCPAQTPTWHSFLLPSNKEGEDQTVDRIQTSYVSHSPDRRVAVIVSEYQSVPPRQSQEVRVVWYKQFNLSLDSEAQACMKKEH